MHYFVFNSVVFTIKENQIQFSFRTSKKNVDFKCNIHQLLEMQTIILIGKKKLFTNESRFYQN